MVRRSQLIQIQKETFHKEKAKQGKENLISYGLKPSWLFVIGYPYGFHFLNPEPFTVLNEGEKKVQCESCELSFFLGQNENYSLGDSISDSSEKLLQRGWGED